MIPADIADIGGEHDDDNTLEVFLFCVFFFV